MIYIKINIGILVTISTVTNKHVEQNTRSLIYALTGEPVSFNKGTIRAVVYGE